VTETIRRRGERVFISKERIKEDGEIISWGKGKVKGEQKSQACMKMTAALASSSCMLDIAQGGLCVLTQFILTSLMK
jgi:hypothetical protein